MSDELRLEGRNGKIWQAFLRGQTQDAIAQRYGLSQPRVSQIIAEVRANIPAPVIADIAQVEADRVAELYAATMEILHASHPLVSLQRGEVVKVTDDEGNSVVLEDAGPKLAAINTGLRIVERVAKAYGTDAATKMETNSQVHYTYEGVNVTDV